jgi:hypothetical protein
MLTGIYLGPKLFTPKEEDDIQGTETSDPTDVEPEKPTLPMEETEESTETDEPIDEPTTIEDENRSISIIEIPLSIRLVTSSDWTTLTIVGNATWSDNFFQNTYMVTTVNIFTSINPYMTLKNSRPPS